MDRPLAAPQLHLLDEALRSRGICVHYTTRARLVRTKALPARKIGGRYYIDLAELDAWIAAQGVDPEEVLAALRKEVVER